jgi:hypothetical protein
MKPGRRRWFLTRMGFAVLATVIAGFAPTCYLKPLFATPALPLSVHIHGALFSAWVLRFAARSGPTSSVQPSLEWWAHVVRARRVPPHNLELPIRKKSTTVA